MVTSRSLLLRWSTLVVSVLTVGCSAISFNDDAPVRTSRKGADFEIRQPSKTAVEGIDVSYFQEAVNWNAVAGDNIRFAYIKATEGGDRVDERFADNYTGAARAGVLRGAYHFWYHCRSGAEQAAWYIQNVPRDASALPPVLDIEWTPTSPTCTKRPPAAELHQDMQAFLDTVEAYYGKRPIIYATIDFYQDRLVGAFEGYPLWVRSTAAEPHERYGDRRWHFWQYTSTGRVAGVPGKADRNVFNGSEQAFQQFLADSVRPIGTVVAER
ncbi:MAG: acm [Proteobacteria bacterium]|nr:acm [Pseudomonadota bacterium]